MDSLTKEQQTVLDTLAEGHNVCMTGCGGTGKSYVLKQLDTRLGPILEAKLGKKPVIHITALTGCAALLLGPEASTLHSWSGIGLGKEDVSDLIWKIQRNGRAKRNWKACDLLVIDEISMMTVELLEKLDDIGKRMRKCFDKPFGGIQLLLVGDFCQLPPVKQLTFAFESERWTTIVPKVIELTVVQRQKDPVFQKILTEARAGDLSSVSEALLKERMGLNWKSHRIRPTLLFPRNAEVNMINDANLKALKGPLKTFDAGISYADLKVAAKTNIKTEDFKRSVAILDRDAMYRDKLLLAEEAQVMLITNLDVASGLVNGSRGVVIGFDAKDGSPIVEFLAGNRLPISLHKWEIDGYPGVFRTQYPLRLAWACTIHKAQGATLDSALIDIGTNTFEYGQAYVALSRVRSLEGLYIHDFTPGAFSLHPKVAAFYKMSS
jgi:ATP-dependent DNA helicase PIF1